MTNPQITDLGIDRPRIPSLSGDPVQDRAIWALAQILLEVSRNGELTTFVEETPKATDQ